MPRLRGPGLLGAWHGDDIAGVNDWHVLITAAMDASPLTVILRTPEMPGSAYVLRHGLPYFRRRHQAGELRVLPVFCEPCVFDPAEPEHAWLDSPQIRPRVSAGSPPSENFPTLTSICACSPPSCAEALRQLALASSRRRREETLTNSPRLETEWMRLATPSPACRCGCS